MVVVGFDADLPLGVLSALLLGLLDSCAFWWFWVLVADFAGFA